MMLTVVAFCQAYMAEEQSGQRPKAFNATLLTVYPCVAAARVIQSSAGGLIAAARPQNSQMRCR